MYTVGKSYSFEAAHFLPEHDGKCRNLHGHSYKVEVTLTGDQPQELGPKSGMIVDFGDLNAAMHPLIAQLDHTVINESWGESAVSYSRYDPEKPSTLGFVPAPPTAEELAYWFYDRLGPWLWESGVEFGQGLLGVSIRVWETEKAWAEFRISGYDEVEGCRRGYFQNKREAAEEEAARANVPGR